MVFGRRQRERRWFAEVHRQRGKRPTVLIADLLPGKNMRVSGERFLHATPELAGIPQGRIFIIRRDDRLAPAGLPGLHRDVRARAADLLAAGTDCVHYLPGARRPRPGSVSWT